MLADAAAAIETDARDAQEIEFTVESGKVWFLQTRAMKRTVLQGVRIAVSLAEEG